MPTTAQHIVKSYDEELKRLTNAIVEMGGAAELHQAFGREVHTAMDVDGDVEIDVRSSVAGWNDNAVYTQRIRNYTSKPIEVEVRRTFYGHVDFVSELPGVKLYDFQTPEFTTTVKAGEKADRLFRVVTRQGRNAKQNNVTLVNGKP